MALSMLVQAVDAEDDVQTVHPVSDYRCLRAIDWRPRHLTADRMTTHKALWNTLQSMFCQANVWAVWRVMGITTIFVPVMLLCYLGRSHLCWTSIILPMWMEMAIFWASAY